MRTVLGLALALAACGLERNPPGPPGGGGGGATRDGGGDGSAGDAADPTRLPGRVCAATDLRQPTACEQRLARAGIDLAIAEDSATTDELGFFVLPRPEGNTALVRIGQADGGVRSAVIEVDATREEIDVPGVLMTDWNALTAVLGAPEPDGSASVALYLVDEDGEPVVGADIVAPNGTVTAPYYDGDSAQGWIQAGATGTFGAVLLFGVPVGADTVDIAVNAPGGGGTASAVPVRADTLTFATRVVP